MQSGDVFDDLTAEQDALEAVLAGLDQDAWCHTSGAAGWTVADVVLHLAQTEEYVIASVTGDEASMLVRDRDGPPLDELMDRLVAVQRFAPPTAVFTRWQTARRAALAALRACSPTVRLRWATIPLAPRTLATTRLAEHWAHALDITVPLGIPYPDT
ncbi:MAG: maleylpyruvate isomerase N-terminal domain-containing protein, partial [Pseudonocardiaceae bacterium]